MGHSRQRSVFSFLGVVNGEPSGRMGIFTLGHLGNYVPWLPCALHNRVILDHEAQCVSKNCDSASSVSGCLSTSRMDQRSPSSTLATPLPMYLLGAQTPLHLSAMGSHANNCNIQDETARNKTSASELPNASKANLAHLPAASSSSRGPARFPSATSAPFTPAAPMSSKEARSSSSLLSRLARLASSADAVCSPLDICLCQQIYHDGHVLHKELQLSPLDLNAEEVLSGLGKGLE